MPPLFLLLGFKGMEELMTMVGLTQNTALQPMKYSDYTPDSRALQIIKQNESKHGEFVPDTKAYYDNQWTIGFGTSFLFNDLGKPALISGSNAIRSGLTLQQIKSAFNSNQNDVQFSERLIINHWRQSRYKVVAKNLDDMKVPFDANLAQSLVDASYNAGSIYGGKYSWDVDNFRFFVIALLNAKTPLQKASLYISYRGGYHSRAMGTNDWNKFGFGLTRRIYHNAQNILGNKISIEQVRKMTNSYSDLRSRIFKEFGVRL